MVRPPKNLLFDCDGVFLDSNKIKSEAFYSVARPFGEAYAKELLTHHLSNGGVSRDRKFKHFFRDILKTDYTNGDIASLKEEYASTIKEDLLSCALMPGLEKFKQETSSIGWLMVSGGNEAELKDLLNERGLSSYFDRGIFGSPKSKEDHFSNLFDQQIIEQGDVYLGDSRYDHVSSCRFNLRFFFVYAWTEFSGWERYCKENKIPSIAFANEVTGVI